MEDQPLPDDASPKALSPGYVVDFDLEKDEKDPEEDPDHADYHADGWDDDDDDDTGDEDEEPFEDEEDDEEEEHLAPADSPDVPVIDPVEESSTAAPKPTGGHKADYGFIGMMDAEIRRQRAEEVVYGIRDVWVDPTEIVEEVAPTTLEGVNARVTELTAVQEQDTHDMYAMIEDAQIQSCLTYTSIYTDSEPGRVFLGADEELSDGGSPRVIVYGYDGLPMQPVAPPSSDYVPGPEHPPSPNFVPSPEHPPSPVYVPYDHADGWDDDDDDDTGDEDEDPFEDDEDDEEEEHLTPAELPRRHTTRMSIRPQTPFPFEAEVERLLALPIPPPSPLTPLSSLLPHIPSSPLPTLLSSLHLPPHVPISLPLPLSPLPPLPASLSIPSPVDRREDTSEAEDVWVDPTETVEEVAPTTLEGVNARVTELTAVQEQDTHDMYAMIQDAQVYQRVDILAEDKQSHYETARLLDQNSYPDAGLPYRLTGVTDDDVDCTCFVAARIVVGGIRTDSDTSG
nr:hypothetical protein [Tanacetum cinerariifolium]